jgi:hypothetical protein
MMEIMEIMEIMEMPMKQPTLTALIRFKRQIDHG